MTRLRTILTTPFPECLRVLPGGHFLVVAIYLLLGGWIHYVAIYSLLSGKILYRSFNWLEARESAPLMYWFYVSAFGAAVSLTDGILLYAFIQRRRGERKNA
jgi:hypothetical protein